MPTLAHLNYASLSDPGMKRLANEDAVASDPHLGLYVVCDGVGGMPSGEAASHLIAHGLGHLIRRALRTIESSDPEPVMGALLTAVRTLNRELFNAARPIPILRDMGATLAAVLIDGPTAYLIHAGDARIYLKRGRRLRQLTRDQTRGQQRLIEQEQGELLDAGERRLLMQFIGRIGDVDPHIACLTLEAGDRLLLCTDGLTDAAPSEVIHEVLHKQKNPTVAAARLVKAANDHGGPDNITLTILDYHGTRQVPADAIKPPPRPRADPPTGAAQRMHEALHALQKDMDWLIAGANEAGQPSTLSALAAVKRRVGTDLYRAFLDHHPRTKNPAHIFHQLCTTPGNPWRIGYQHNIKTLEAPLGEITAGRVRLSPVLTAEQTALICKTLWRDWRRVELRYFTTCQRDAIDASEKTLDILINHMRQSVMTLAGLLEFLPRFLRGQAEKAPPG